MASGSEALYSRPESNQLLGRGLTVLLGPCFNVFEVWDDDRDEVRLEGVAVDENFLDVRTLEVDALKLFGSDVFALCQLKNILSSIDNFDRAIWHDHAYISSPEPSILDRCFCFLFILEVARGH